MSRILKLINHHWHLSATVHHWLVISSSFSLFLLVSRMIATHTLNYGFLAWNLVLAFIPYLLSGMLVKDPGILENRRKRYLVLCTWLLFVPNSFYILTDLFHLDHFSNAPQWFDLLLILSFAWNGLVCGLVSLRRVESLVANRRGGAVSFLLVYCVICLNAFGIYIGRYLRFNSWDILTDPFSLFTEIMYIIFNPLANFPAWGMTLGYSVFFTLLYYMFRRFQHEDLS